jgi:hypothetical protein
MSLSDAFADKVQSVGTGVATQASCSAWSTRRRIMGHPFPGPYSWRYHPWVREILDAKAEYVVTLKSAQGGWTEAAINKALYTIDVCKRDVLYVLPTASNAQDFSQARFGGALSESPYLKNIFTATNKVSLKQAGSTNLYIRGSRGDSNLKSVPASLLILDEFDEFDQKAVGLALERLSGQIEKEVWFVSTPTIPNFGVHKEYIDTTQEHFMFQCPHCGKQTELLFPECIEIIGEGINDPRIRESFLKCKECGNKLDHEAKPEFLSKAKWVPTNSNGHPSRRGFHTNQLYSMTVKPWEIATAYFRGLVDDQANKEFHNSKLGIPFVGDGAQVSDTQIDACMSGHSINDPRPTMADRLITMGIDQGRTGYSAIIEWNIIDVKDPLPTARAKLLGYYKFDQNNNGLTDCDSYMVEWQVIAAVIDADPEIGLARDFARRFRKHVHLCRYRKGVTGNEMSISDEHTGAAIATVDRTFWISQALAMFKTGRIELPRETSTEFKDHIKSMVSTWRKDENGESTAVFVSTSADHFAHCITMACVALPFAIKKFYSVAEDI